MNEGERNKEKNRKFKILELDLDICYLFICLYISLYVER